MNLLRSVDFYIELAASLFTVGGIFLGTTTFLGAIVYGCSLAFWWVLTFRRAMWGLLPLQVSATGVTAWNLWRVW